MAFPGALALVTGGLGLDWAVLEDGTDDRPSAELICADALTGGEACTWDLGAGPMRRPRYGHRASALPDGTVLSSGGYDETNEALAVLELYNPNFNCGDEIVPPE